MDNSCFVARPKSDDKRRAILDAAVRIIVKQGLSAPTAAIAREAGIANGSLFTYFPTKTELFNDLYVELKSEMADAALHAMPAKAATRDQMFHLWAGWMEWARHRPERRRALAQLGVSDEITAASRMAGHQTMASIAGILERGRAKGALRNAPLPFVVTLLSAVSDATMDFVVSDPRHADQHSKAGFEALWRMLS